MDSQNQNPVDSQKLEIMAQFLLAEHQQLHERARHFNQMAQTQTAYYLTLTTAAITGLAYLHSSPHLLPTFYTFAPIITYLLFLLGSLQGMHALNFYEDSTVFYRLVGRIRKWFSNLDAGVLPYLPFDPVDDRPEFVIGGASLRHLESTPIVLTVVWGIAWVGSLIATFLSAAEQGSITGVLSILAWFLFGIVFYLSFVRTGKLATKQLQEKEKRYIQSGQVHFPSLPLEGQQPKREERKDKMLEQDSSLVESAQPQKADRKVGKSQTK